MFFTSDALPNATQRLLSRSPPLSAALPHSVTHPSISLEAAARAGRQRPRRWSVGASPGPGGPPPSPLTRPRSVAAGAHPEGPCRHPHHPDCGHCCTRDVNAHLPLPRHRPRIPRWAAGGAGAASSRAPVGYVLRAAGGVRAASRGHRRPAPTRRVPAPFLLKQVRHILL